MDGVGDAAKEAGTSALDSSVESIQTTLRSIERPRGRQSVLWSASRRSLKPARFQPRDEANADLAHAKNLQDQLSSPGLHKIAKIFTDMAAAVAPITTAFDNVLKEPATKNFNATLNAVPVIGIRGDKVMYLQRTVSSKGTDVDERWAVLSNLPAGVRVAPGATNVFLFSHAGALCLAIGRTVWRKAHDRPDSDEASRAKAMDDWPELYVDHWDKLGDAVLPAGDLRGVVSCSTYSTTKKTIEFRVVVLKADGSLHALEGLKGSDSIKELKFTHGTSALNLVRIAYWDGQIVGFDVADNMVSIAVNFGDNSCSVVDTTPDSAVAELTANEAWPIVVRDDGFLYKPAVETELCGGGYSFTWSKWVGQEGVAHLAVASPGVFLSLNTLARALRSRYFATQAAFHLVVSKFSAFSATHEVFLEQMRKVRGQQFVAAANGAEKQAVAVKQGRAFVDHAKPWSTILHLSVDGSKECFHSMTAQLSDVHDHLKTQLHILLDMLMNLQPLLTDPDETIDRVRAIRYGALGANFLGVAMAVISGGEIPGGGALAVGALVAAILEGKKVSELSGKIRAETESQVTGVTNALTEIRALVDSYDNLQAKFDALNLFWRGTSSGAHSLGSMRNATAEKIGLALLDDDEEASITSALQATSELGNACKKYLDALHKHGVTPVMVQHGVSAHMMFKKSGHHGSGKHAHHGQSASHRQSAAAAKSASTQKDLLETFRRHVHDAQGKLKAHDHDGYVAAITQARFVSFATIASAADVQVVSGHWFDVSVLSRNARAWNGYHDPIHVRLMDGPARDEISNAQRRLNGELNHTKPLVVAMLEEVVLLGKLLRKWKAKFPQPPGRANSELEKLKKEALEQCKATEAVAARAYSRFSVLERQAVKWQQGRESEIADCLDAIKANLGEDSRVGPLETTISQLRELQRSANEFYRNAYTWIRMCEQVGEMVGGDIHNILTALAYGDDDPMLYNAVVGADWTRIVTDATTLLDVLGSEHHDAITSEANDEALLRALTPDTELGGILQSQIVSAEEVFIAVNAIAELDASSGLVAFWDEAKERKTTMLDVAHHVRDQYVQLVATEYDVIEKLYTLSILQEIRAYNYAEQGKIPLDALIKVTFQSFSAAFHVANRAAVKYSDFASEFDSAISHVIENLANVHEKIQSAAFSEKNLDEHKKEAVCSAIADAIAAAVSSPMAFSYAASAVTQTLIESSRIGLGFSATADNLKVAVRDLRSNELAQLRDALRVVKELGDATAKQLAAVQPLFHKLVDGLKDVAASLLESSERLHRLLQRTTTQGTLGTITTDDTTRIEEEWKKMGTDARAWMEAIDNQYISHVTLSVHSF